MISKFPIQSHQKIIRVSSNSQWILVVIIKLFDFNLTMNDIIQLHVFQLISYGPMNYSWFWLWVYEESYELMNDELLKICMIYENNVLWTKVVVNRSINEIVKGFLTYAWIVKVFSHIKNSWLVKGFLSHVRIMIYGATLWRLKLGLVA